MNYPNTDIMQEASHYRWSDTGACHNPYRIRIGMDGFYYAEASIAKFNDVWVGALTVHVESSYKSSPVTQWGVTFYSSPYFALNAVWEKARSYVELEKGGYNVEEPKRRYLLKLIEIQIQGQLNLF